MRIPLATLLLVATALPARAEVVDRIVATVDGRAITELELRRSELTGGLERVAGEGEEHYRARVLSEMIDEYLRFQDAMRFAPVPPDAAELNTAMEDLSARLKSEGKDPQEEFRKAGMSPEEVRATLERQLVVTRYLKERFAALALVTPEEIQAEYGKLSEEMKKRGDPIPALEAVEEQLRGELRAHRSSEEIEKWTRDLREKARITVLGPPAALGERKPVLVSKSP